MASYGFCPGYPNLGAEIVVPQPVVAIVSFEGTSIF